MTDRRGGQKGGFHKGFHKTPRGCLYRHALTGGWYWKVRKPGQAKYSYLPLVLVGQKYATKSRAHAEARRRQLWREWTQDGAKAVESRSMAGWIDQFERWCRSTASARQARFNADVARRFVTAQALAQPWDITPEAVQAYLQGLQWGPGTIRHHRNALSRFCRFLGASGQLDGNPAQHPLIALPRIRRYPPRFLTWRQSRVLFRRLQGFPTLQRPVTFCLALGLRVGEMARVCPGDFIETPDLLLRVESAKAAASEPVRLLPLPPPARRAVAGMLEGSPKVPIFGQRGVREWVRLLKMATEPLPVFGELPGRRAGNQWHLLRSTWAVNQARKGLDPYRLMYLGGWSSLQTVMRYVNIARASGMA